MPADTVDAPPLDRGAELVLTVAISTVLMSYPIIYPTTLALRNRLPEVPRPFLVSFGRPGVIVVLTGIGLLLGTLERRREAQDPMAGADIGMGSR